MERHIFGASIGTDRRAGCIAIFDDPEGDLFALYQLEERSSPAHSLNVEDRSVVVAAR